MTQFSIIIPTYNNLALLQSALCSVTSQTYNHYEIIITDDSTNNKIKLYIESLHNDKIRYFHHTKDDNPISNWNHGIAKATKDFIIILHHDETLGTTTYLSTINDEIKKGSDIIISHVKVYDHQQLRQPIFPNCIKRTFISHPALLFLCNAIGPSACLTVKRELVTPFCEQLHWLVDVNWYYEVMHKHECRLLSEDVFVNSYNSHQDKITHNIDIKQTEKSDYNVLTKKYRFHPFIRTMLFFNKIATVYNLKQIIKHIIRK
ncbi:glycosyltransferase family 2 protein [Bacteroides pyogenes]|uniref:glycosyltransferase family 2 protein n=1 Tax=Bacteroides pyogenes TaxID=310300 RepID=UPI002FDAA509